METYEAYRKIIPLVTVVLRGWTTSSRHVRENILFLDRVCQEEGAVKGVVVGRRSERGRRLTFISVRAAEPFVEQNGATTWWAGIVSRLKELPYRQLLAERLSRMSFARTTPEIVELVRRRNGRGKPQPAMIQERKRCASDVFFSDTKAAGHPSNPAEEPAET